MPPNPEILELKEYQTCSLPAENFTEHQAKALYTAYKKQVSLEPPSFLNEQRWQLTPQGWVGYIPLCSDLHLSLVPKVPVANLFRMLEYAYRLDFKILEGLADSESIADIYERLALVLAKRVLDRIRRGLYRAYVPESADLPYVRGRIDVIAHLRSPSRISLPCHFEEHTSDLEENQILLWTLTGILESGICSERSLPHIRRARRTLMGFCTMVPFSASVCANRLYNRLNHDYEALHALCRFFLEHTGPTHRLGDRCMLPILVNMERLFELFVVEWLKQHMPHPYAVRAQETVRFNMGHVLTINIDITVTDIETGETCLVLDTKYKAPDQPAMADIEQVVAYAEAKQCNQAGLIYPVPLSKPIAGQWSRNITVRSLTFSLDDDLDAAGESFLYDLIHAQGGRSQ